MILLKVTLYMLRRLGVYNTRSRKLMYDSWYIAYEYLNTPGLSYCSRMYNIIWERYIHGMRRQHHRYSHKLCESYGVFCNQFEVINIISFENVTTCNVSAANVFSFIRT